ncbi:hypothetical protein ABT324_24235 [Saccharopolyspora sp. NPDC000359]|uniref:hypothetical protein n=1 Tax=Saccharopolyspora sp. NPDC000359 TaxID=3154251 RepID=UPI003333C2C3
MAFGYPVDREEPMMRWWSAALVGACLAGVSACGSGSASEAPTAQQVVEQFQRDGLMVPNPRDNTSGNCERFGCTQMITTDAVTIMVFPDEAAATKIADRFGENAFRHGAVVLQYAAARTPEDQQAKFEGSLAAMPG